MTYAVTSDEKRPYEGGACRVEQGDPPHIPSHGPRNEHTHTGSQLFKGTYLPLSGLMTAPHSGPIVRRTRKYTPPPSLMFLDAKLLSSAAM